MKLFLRLLWCVCLSVLVWSCADESERTLPVDDVPVVFTTAGLSAVGVSSRASNDSWSVNDAVGIYMVPHNTEASAAANFSVYTDFSNVHYRTLSSGSTVAFSPVDAPILFPSDATDRVNFVAYYPYKSGIHIAATPHVYPVDVTIQNPSAAIDLLYHKDSTAYSKNSGKTVELSFSHGLSKLLVSIIPESGVTTDLSASSVSLTGFPRKASFGLAGGTFSGLTDVGTITPIKKVRIERAGDDVMVEAGKLESGETPNTDYVLFESLLIPTKGSDKYARAIHFTIGGTAYSYTLPDSCNLVSGKAYSYEFRYTGRGIALGSDQIVDWDAGSTSWNEGYHLTVSESSVSFPKEISSKVLSVTTNYGSVPSVVCRNTKSTADNSAVNWLTATLSGSSGIYNLTCTTTSMPTALRTAYVYVTVGNMTVIVEVTQQKYGLTSGTVFESANCIVLKTDGVGALIPVKIANDAASYSGVSAGRADGYVAPFTTLGTIEFDAKVLWVDSPSFASAARRTTTATNIIAEVGAVCSDLANSYLYVKPGTKEGNAVVCITKKGTEEIIWSWHIWVLGSSDRNLLWIKGSTENSLFRPAISANNYAFMPLHLGAFNSADDGTAWNADTGWAGHPFVGLYYQWGRKDPITNRIQPTVMGTGLGPSTLPSFTSITGFVAENTATRTGMKSIANPHYFNWSSDATDGWQGTIHLTGIANNSWGYANSKYGSKSPFDPCPAGWRVPAGFDSSGATHDNNAWKGASAARGTWTTTHAYGINGYPLETYGGFHPAAGYRGNGAVFHNGGSAGRYWSAGPHTSYVTQGYDMHFSGSTLNEGNGNGNRSNAWLVRCVAE